MEQVYFVRPGEGKSGLECVYQYGNYTYYGPLDVPRPTAASELGSTLAGVQRVQGAIPFYAETASLEEGSVPGKCLAALGSAMEFISEEMTGVVDEIAELAETETWLDSEGAALYFEFEATERLNLEDATVVFAKVYRSDVMITAVFFGGRFYVTLSEASGAEQDLVDTMFPHFVGRRRGMQLRTYDHPGFAKMGVWEAGDAGSPAAALEDEAAGAAAAASGDSDADAVADMSGDGYMQIYAVMRPTGGTSSRAALFRYGGWVYTGKVDFGLPALHLGDIPEMLPALQRQQGRLEYTCDVGAFPVESAFFPVVRQYMAAVSFLHDEMIAVQDTLAEMAEVGITSWIDADWAASFFELALELTPELRAVEAIASKTYFESGIVLHCVLFGSSLYCVLANAAADLPLLDVAFPDVTARCRGAQVKAYGAGQGPAGPGMPKAQRLTVWEGRRRGVKGVGWGTVAAVKEDAAGANAGAEIRAKARERAEAEEAARRATMAMLGGKGAAKASAAAAADAAASDGKEADEAKPAAADAAAPVPAAASSAGSPSKLRASGAARAPHHLGPMPAAGSGAARAPHHLPSLGSTGGGGGRLLSSLPALDPSLAKAPWDAAGKPLRK